MSNWLRPDVYETCIIDVDVESPQVETPHVISARAVVTPEIQRIAGRGVDADDEFLESLGAEGSSGSIPAWLNGTTICLPSRSAKKLRLVPPDDSVAQNSSLATSFRILRSDPVQVVRIWPNGVPVLDHQTQIARS
jgi:hypothetical protein